MTPFRFEYEFRAPSPAVVFEGYFDPALSAEQDRRVEVATRELIELDDQPTTLRRVCKVSPRRQLPAIIRPLVSGDLSYVERLIWHKGDDRIEMQIEPSVLSGRVAISAEYRLVAAGPGLVLRTYEGRVSVDLRLVGARVERGVIEDLGRSLTISAACTQEWLDRRAGPPGVSPH
jgi:hypothetical protein